MTFCRGEFTFQNFTPVDFNKFLLENSEFFVLHFYFKILLDSAYLVYFVSKERASNTKTS